METMDFYIPKDNSRESFTGQHGNGEFER